MGAPGDEEGFKVTDRRRRSGGPEEPLWTPGGMSSETPASRPTPVAATTFTGDPPKPSPAEERSLVGLFMMLGSTAAAALGAPDPVTGEAERDPAQAATLIDLLGLLRERTEGNRTPDETQVLDELIYDLQLRYVQVTKRSG